MKALVLYTSKFGHTKLLAEAIAGNLEERELERATAWARQLAARS